ncbi:MAG TPA: hypothetical protein VMV69_23915 [Pirellulales bacterium]|nr:hypothetical protein [Pirellulales bacterium]
MAKEKSVPGVSKTDIVRDYLEGNPAATARQIVADLTVHGISESLAAKVKSRYGLKTSRKKPGRKPQAAMASTHGTRGTKADAIREIAKSVPKPFRPRDVRAVLAEQGIAATTTLIGKVLRSMGMKRKRRRKTIVVGAARAVSAHSASVSIDDLVAAKKLVGQIGSIEKVKEALAALARLS